MATKKTAESKDESTQSEAQASAENVVMPAHTGVTGPTQDDLNPAYAPPRDDKDEKKK